MEANEFYIVEDRDGNILNQEYINQFMSEERWLDVKGFEGIYQISNYGMVKALDKIVINVNGGKWYLPEKIMKQKITKQGYKGIMLQNEGVKKNYRLHRLVLMSFLGLPINDKLQVNHIDENKLNNRLNNLNYCYCDVNNNYGNHNKRMKETKRLIYGRHIKQYSLDGTFIKEWQSGGEINDHFGKRVYPNIQKCCKGILKQCYGFKWQYADE